MLVVVCSGCELCQLIEADGWLPARVCVLRQLLEAGLCCLQWGVNSVRYNIQVGIWQPECVYSVSYLWQVGGCLLSVYVH